MRDTKEHQAEQDTVSRGQQRPERRPQRLPPPPWRPYTVREPPTDLTFIARQRRPFDQTSRYRHRATQIISELSSCRTPRWKFP
jgi:hypothetical protein